MLAPGGSVEGQKEAGGGLHLNLSLGTSSSCSLVGEKFRLWQCWSSALAAQQFLGSAGHPKSSEPGPGKAIKKKLDLTNPCWVFSSFVPLFVSEPLADSWVTLLHLCSDTAEANMRAFKKVKYVRPEYLPLPEAVGLTKPLNTV